MYGHAITTRTVVKKTKSRTKTRLVFCTARDVIKYEDPFNDLARERSVRARWALDEDAGPPYHHFKIETSGNTKRENVTKGENVVLGWNSCR